MPGAMMRHPGHRQCECTGQDQKAAVHHGHIRFDEQCMNDIFVGVLAHFDIERFHLVGHSMGGLTALLLAHEYPDRVLSFVDIEGIASEDCFLSRQIVDYPTNDPETFSAAFIERARHAPAYASALYAASLRHKVRAGAVRGIFQSMVDLSDNADLMRKFLGLKCPRMFMYGEQNAWLSYLPHIQALGVRLAPVAHCGHFPDVFQLDRDVAADRRLPVEQPERVMTLLLRQRGSGAAVACFYVYS